MNREEREMVYDAFSGLVMNISLFGGGLIFAVLAVLFGLTRGMTKNDEMWALIFASFAWLLALIVPNVPWAATIFVAAHGNRSSRITTTKTRT